MGTEEEQNASWTHEFPVTLMQFLLYLYHNQPDFAALCASADFLCALAATLFPYRSLSESESELSSPLEDFKVSQRCWVFRWFLFHIECVSACRPCRHWTLLAKLVLGQNAGRTQCNNPCDSSERLFEPTKKGN